MDKRRRIFLLLSLSLCISSEGLVARATTLRGAKSARSPQASAEQPRGQTATLLSDGRILLLGGEGANGPLSAAAVQDPQTGAVTPLNGQLQQPRAWHTATVLPDGTVLVFGGTGTRGEVLSTAESFDPATLSFHILPATGLVPRAHHTATLLTDGLLFVAGGASPTGETSGTAQLWDFRNNVATNLAGLITPRHDQSAVLLPDGTVLLWGGIQGNGMAIPDGEIFDPTSKSFRIQTFSFKAARGQVPQVEANLPEDGSENVPLTALIAARFSQPLQVKSVNSGSVTLSGPDGSIAAKVISAEGGMLAFVIPQEVLLPGTTYKVTLAGAMGASATPLTASSFSFQTAGQAPQDSGVLGGAQNPTNDPLDSPFRKLPPLQASPGVTAISGQVLLLDGQPLEGVTLRAGANHTETDRTGRFLLQNVSGSHVAMVIDGRSASQKRVTYGVFEDGVDITSGRTTVLQYTVWMPEIDTANAATLSFPTTKEVVLTTPRIPGLEFHIPAGTTITDIDGKVTNQVSITPIPISQPPFPLPAGVNVPVYFTIQPGGGYLSVQNSDGPKGGWLVYPNSFHQAPGSSFDFWNYDADEKGWFIYGHGKVTPDGKSVVPDPGVLVYELTGAMVGGSGQGANNGPGILCEFFGLFCDGEPVDLSTGLFVYKKTDLYLSDIIPIRLTRTYRPNDGASRGFGIGTSHNDDLFLVGTTFPYTYMDLVFADGARVECPRTSPGTSFADAVYQCNSMPGQFFAATIAWNGNGWTLTRRDGFLYKFPDGFNSSRAQQNAVLSITDRNGNALNFTRDAKGDLTQVTSPNGRWIQFTYDTNLRITQAQDNIGRTVQYSYDTGGRLTQVTDPNGGVWKYTYDASNNMTSLVDARNITVLQNQFDSQNRVIVQTLADGVSTYHFSYNPTPCTTNCSGIWETDVTDPNGSVKKVTFNSGSIFSNGFTTGGSGATVTYAAGTSIAQTFTYQYQTGNNFITNVTDALNRTTSYSYDQLGNLISATRLAGTPNAVTSSRTYEAKFSQITSVTDPLNHTTTYAYDSKGNLISITDPLGNTSTRSYNTAGQVISATDPLGETVTYAYDGADLSSASDAIGRTTIFFTDSAGRRVSATDALSNTTKYTYDALDRITQIVDRGGNLTSYAYDPDSHLLSVTDSRNTSTPTTFTYDNMGRVATRTDPLGNQESFQYDGTDRLTQFTDRRGKVRTHTYDALRRRTFSGFGKSGTLYESTITYTYDAASRLTQAVDSITGTITRGYDGLDHLTSETTPQGAVSYTYDNACRRTSFTPPGQSVANYFYDNANRLTQITQGTASVSFSYDAANRRTTLTLPNGVSTAYTYDPASELTGLAYASGSNALGNLAYAYDLVGRRVSVSGAYARTGIPLAISTTAYNADNELTTWGTANLFYDANGNMTSDGTHSYTWDARNHLTSIDGGSTATYTYDPFGRRASRNILGTTTTFLYDRSNITQEVIGGSNTANSLTGRTDEVFQRIDAGGARDFLADVLGDTLALTDSTGAVQTQYTFEPFGNTAANGSASTNSFAFTGRELDAAGLYFYRARYYSPVLQRFVSEDPIGLRGGINVFAYAKDRPTILRDPKGLCPGCEGGPTGGGWNFTGGDPTNGGGGDVGGGSGGSSGGGNNDPGCGQRAADKLTGCIKLSNDYKNQELAACTAACTIFGKYIPGGAIECLKDCASAVAIEYGANLLACYIEFEIDVARCGGGLLDCPDCDLTND
jgi:RHS repeat-associated protein